MSERVTPLPTLPLSDLSSPDPTVRAAAAEVFARAGEGVGAAAPTLVRACGDAEERVREEVVAALEGSGEPPPETLPELIDLVSSREALVAYWAVTLVGRCGERAEAAVPALASRLAADSPIEVRQRAAWALEKLGPVAASAATALRDAARDADPRLARLAAAALARFGT